MAASRARYLVPPLLALGIVIGVQVYNGLQSAPAPVAPVVDAAPPREDGIADPVPVTNVVPLGAVDTSDTDRRIEFWRARAEATPPSHIAWTYIGDLFDLKGRQTGDFSHFVAAGEAYDKALGIAPNSSSAHAGKARIFATLHDFGGAVAEATLVLQLDTSANDALGVIFDASVELGDLDSARLALERLGERVQSPAVTIRQARLAFLDGDTATAAQLAGTAARAAQDSASSSATVAFYQYSAAEYALLSGDLEGAAAGYAAALESLPHYPLAIFGQGRVAYARGDMATATALLESSAAALPRPDVIAFLGDLYALAGEDAKAADQYATVDFIANLAAADGGAVYDREYALFLADHGFDPERAVALAEAEAAVRHDVYAFDTLAWALHAAGRDAEALEAARSSQELGTVDAKLLIHAGLIELANGLAAEGRAHLEAGLSLNPTISPLVVEKAREALGQ